MTDWPATATATEADAALKQALAELHRALLAGEPAEALRGRLSEHAAAVRRFHRSHAPRTPTHATATEVSLLLLINLLLSDQP